MDKFECPVCGRMIDPDYAVYLDNGSPACADCAEQEQNNEK